MNETRLFCDEHTALRALNGNDSGWWPTHYRRADLPDYGWVWFIDWDVVRRLGILEAI